ncbi:mechanosensitive ion channel family protein [Mangrovibacterium marinum]|uniref:Small-conductance mechanosensitive channel n=1 Tax=Mangrovibacterium marinum TaxID=1639118 RepID=A0A2T5C3G2_9BACT|nr:mechanosensitive ion channel domain-containing protein [Mangrovibacterium marinum]PTN09320.1 small-conductance mechanosensitive channel [Mangrovibacterium marinum]
MNDLKTPLFVIVSVIVGILLAVFILKKLKAMARNDAYERVWQKLLGRLGIPLGLLIILSIASVGFPQGLLEYSFVDLHILQSISFNIVICWILIVLIKSFRMMTMAKYDISAVNNLKARKIQTQLVVIERILIIVVLLFAFAVSLLSFPRIRQVGMSLLASAGIAGIIIGFAAQRSIALFLAGIQIAFTQPIRLDDVVIVEGEWGWIEEITLTYVVVRIWDKRRLIVPITYFIDKPFQNWTRTTAEILGTVFIYVDYGFPVDAMREELTRILERTPEWDGQVNVLQVTDSKEMTMEIRALMSAANSPAAWDLRVKVREELIRFVQEKYPQHLPRTRVVLPDSTSPGKR